MLARSKLNSIENKISKALMDTEISHEDFETIINKEKKYRELKESIRMMTSACGPFTKNKERIKKFKQTGDINYIYKNELDKACFQYDMAYGDFKDLARRTASDNILRDKAFNIAKILNMMGIKEGLLL